SARARSASSSALTRSSATCRARSVPKEPPSPSSPSPISTRGRWSSPSSTAGRSPIRGSGTDPVVDEPSTVRPTATIPIAATDMARPLRCRVHLSTPTGGSAGARCSRTGRRAQTTTRPASNATLVAYSVLWNAIRTPLVSATAAPYRTPPARPVTPVRGSVIMKNTKMSTSGDRANVVQNCIPATGPRFHRAVMAWPLIASTPMRAANTDQNATDTRSRSSRRVTSTPPTTTIAYVAARPTDIGPHQRSCGSAIPEPRTRNVTTNARLDGLKSGRPRDRRTYFDSTPTAVVAANTY